MSFTLELQDDFVHLRVTRPGKTDESLGSVVVGSALEVS